MKKDSETHYTDRVGWLRAAVMGANDGIVSTASLVIGVAAASADHTAMLTAGIAGLAAGALSMAAGEYVSVSSQSDTEQGDLERERIELFETPERELAELKAIYVGRGLEPGLAQQVAMQLTAHDALGAHARDELGLSHLTSARPTQAALSSAATFMVGAALPLATAALVPISWAIPVVAATSLLFLAGLGAASASAGGAKIGVAAWRVTFWGALAMGLTAGIGALFGAVV